MKSQSTEVMVTHIRAILEQNQNPEDLVSRDDVRTLSIEALIANFLEEAVSMAVMNADESLFGKIDTISANNTNSIELGYGVQRILQITGESWNGVVKEVLHMSSPIYRMCKNRYLNMTGVKDRPVAFRDWSSVNDRRKIEVFPSVTGKLTVFYIKKAYMGYGNIGDEAGNVYAEVDEDYSDLIIPCDDLIYEGACFYCAYLVAMVQGWNTSETYRKEAVEALKAVNAESVRAAVRSMANDQ